MAQPWSTDADMQQIMSSLPSYPDNVFSWDDLRARGEARIIMWLVRGWYRTEAWARSLDPAQTPLEPARLDATQLNEASSLATLAAICENVKAAADDVYGAMAADFWKRAEREVAAIVDAGVNYDWSNDGTIGTEDTGPARPRRLVRI